MQNANPGATEHLVVPAKPTNLAPEPQIEPNPVPEILKPNIIVHQNPLEGLLKQIAGSYP